ncbi:MAG: hypothetical protein EWM72_00131 [Nitrospira sp.]|nr:MAG: hypothetical protein EWM72_00131 [Nitrospira sp.]
MSATDEHDGQASHSRLPEYFVIAERSLAICRSYEPQIVIDSDHPQRVHAAAFFAKLLRDADAALLLLKLGMVSQARSMLRVAIECEIILAKCCKSPEFCEAYRIVAEQERLRLLKGIRRINPGDFNEVKDVINEEMVNKLADALRGAPEKKLEQWASEVGMGTLYQTGYRLYSADVHSGVRCLQHFLTYDQSGIPSEINWRPAEIDCRVELTEVSRVALNGLSLAGNLFGLTHDEAFKQHVADHHRLEELVEQ